MITTTLEHLDVQGVAVKAIDKGALDCTIKARMITVLHRGAEKKRMIGRSWTHGTFKKNNDVCPRANAAMLRDAPLYGADSIMFDLEDFIKRKDSARVLVHSALKTFDYGNIEIVVRINALDAGGAEDIEAMVLAGVDVIRLPKQKQPKISLMSRQSLQK